jgi:hypothetical protein
LQYLVSYFEPDIWRAVFLELDEEAVLQVHVTAEGSTIGATHEVYHWRASGNPLHKLILDAWSRLKDIILVVLDR